MAARLELVELVDQHGGVDDAARADRARLARRRSRTGSAGSCTSRRRRRSCARRSARPGSGRRGRSPGRAGRRSCPCPRRPTARRRSRSRARHSVSQNRCDRETLADLRRAGSVVPAALAPPGVWTSGRRRRPDEDTARRASQSRRRIREHRRQPGPPGKRRGVAFVILIGLVDPRHRLGSYSRSTQDASRRLRGAHGASGARGRSRPR